MYRILKTSKMKINYIDFVILIYRITIVVITTDESNEKIIVITIPHSN